MEECVALDESKYWPGYVGLNNLKNTEYLNVVLQTFSKITPLRNLCLRIDCTDSNTGSSSSSNASQMTHCFISLVKKMWNPQNFKNHVSPHELLEVISESSQKRFSAGKQSDPITLIAWLINNLCAATTIPNLKHTLHKTFQGKLNIHTLDQSG